MSPTERTEQPIQCPDCGNAALSRYLDSSACVCGWSNGTQADIGAVVVEVPRASRLNVFVGWLLKLYVHFFVEIDHKTKCPGCGHRTWHTFEYRKRIAGIVHTCVECRAEWKEDPVANSAAWSIPSVTHEQQRQAPQGEKAPRS